MLSVYKQTSLVQMLKLHSTSWAFATLAGVICPCLTFLAQHKQQG